MIQAEKEARAKEKATIRAYEEKTKRQAEEKARIQAEEVTRLIAEEASSRKAEEEARRKAKHMAKARADEEAKVQKIVRKATIEAKLRAAEEEARNVAKEEAQLLARAEESKLRQQIKEKDVADNSSSKQSTENGDETFIVYRDMRNTLAMVPLSKLTEQLGYTTEEAMMFQSDAMAVIVADNISRPRIGIPPQWKQNSSNDEQFPVVVDTIEEAEALIETDLEEQRKEKRRPKSTTPGKSGPSTKEEELGPDVSSDSTSPEITEEERGRNSSSRGHSRRSRGDTMGEPSNPRSRQRVRADDRRRQEGPLSSKEQLKNEEDDDISSPRRRSRSRRVSEENSKRIYDARQTPASRNNVPIRPDPPAPSYWPDMNTFRTLLRSEAGLRLRILGDDWTETVKQESDWRLNLYRDWLWTLHDGVGDPIVPPSRYERARKIQRSPPSRTPPDGREERTPSQRSRDIGRKRSNSKDGGRIPRNRIRRP
jgi:hypothetical protein